MRNYIILNNKKSDTISGLIIQELPPISKPAQRTQIETIDGRDGDIVTPLGYAAYDKTFTIGLYGSFDINEIIAYFATQGQVIFSNEPNKYYNYQIVDQIDYDRLVRYRVATVTMHVQPFKYSSTESPIIVDSSDTVSGEGSDIALANTAEAPFNVLRHKGNATQTTLSGRNLLPSNGLTELTDNGITFTPVYTDGLLQYINVNGTYTGSQSSFSYTIGKLDAKANQTYTISGSTGGSASTYRIWTDSSVAFPAGNRLQSANGAVTATALGDEDVTTRIQVFKNIAIDNVRFYPQIEAGSAATDYEPYCGGVPSPNPDYPQDIQVVTGDQTIKITGKNIINADRETGANHGYTYTNNGDGSFIISGTSDGSTSSYTLNTTPFQLKAGNTYTISLNNPTAGSGSTIQCRLINADGSGVVSGSSTSLDSVDKSYQFTPIADFLANFQMRISANTVLPIGFTVKLQIELGNQATPFEAYKVQSYVIPFGDTYLAKIGDYADEPVKVDGTWYIRRAIGKEVYTGASGESWGIQQTNTSTIYYQESSKTLMPTATTILPLALCDQFTGYKGGYLYNAEHYGFALSTNGYFRISMLKSVASDVNALKTWLSSHNATVYYVLPTPTDEAITDQDLIDALDEFFGQAHAYKAGTFITATPTSGNAPAVLSVNVNEDNESTVTNAGNTTSRPILTIYGQGDIGVYINDVEVLQVALNDEGYITLDSVEMEAYKDSTANLKNRLVTGDYSKLALNAGANKIRFTGIVTKYEISKYSRWL